MPRSRHRSESSHEQAVGILEKHARENLAGTLEATAQCNECHEELTIDLMARAASVERNQAVGPVRPDLSVFDHEGVPLRFIEVVDTHKPETNVHEYALEHGIEVVEFHLNADREFTGRRRNRALDASLTIKTRLKELESGILRIDAHTRLCQRPKCQECLTPLPMRTIIVSTKDCWNCGQNVNVAIGSIDGSTLEQDEFTSEELEFVRKNGANLERRMSATVGFKYLANVCTNCDQIQGNWFLYMDPFHDRFNLHQTERQQYGPCSRCAMRICLTHGEYTDFREEKLCPECLRESERVVCPNRHERDCYFPDKCEATGCYFLNREAPIQAPELPSDNEPRMGRLF